MNEINTERLWMRPSTMEDASFLLKLFETPLWQRFCGERDTTSLEAVEEYIRSVVIKHQDELGYTNNTVFLKSTSEPIGVCGVYYRPESKRHDLGFGLLPEYFKQGYGFEAATAQMKHAKHDLNLRELHATTLPDNLASIQLLKKLGFEEIGVDETDLLFHKKL